MSIYTRLYEYMSIYLRLIVPKGLGLYDTSLMWVRNILTNIPARNLTVSHGPQFFAGDGAFFEDYRNLRFWTEDDGCCRLL